MRTLIPIACLLGLASSAAAQVTQNIGPSPNATPILDFDNPFVPSGPISGTDPVFTSAGIESVSLVGTWTVSGDTLTGPSNVNGQVLVSQGGALTVGAAGDPLDNAMAGAGFDIQLAGLVSEFQLLFADQVNMAYDVEVFQCGVSLGTGSFTYSGGFPNPPDYWTSTGVFDRILITFPSGSGGVGIDELATRGAIWPEVGMTDCLPGTWIDISGTGTALSLSDDGEVDIPYTFTGSIVPGGFARVGSNGAVRFCGSGTSLGFVNEVIPSTAAFGTDQVFMPFWDDINTSSGTNGEIYWEQIGSTLVVQWENVAFFGSLDRATFQLQVNQSGPVYAQYLYQDVSSPRADRGGSATVGYQAGPVGQDAQWSSDVFNSVRDGMVLSLYDVNSMDVFVRDDIAGSFIDISGTGTALSLGDDSEVDIPTTIGNTLLPAGIARVGSNGAVRFAGAGQDLAFTNAAIPAATAFSGDQTLMPFWDDIDTQNGMWGEIYWQEIGDKLIVQWENVAFFNGSATQDRTTFQLQVNGHGPVAAQFLYADVSSPRADGGGSATIGYQAGGIGNDAQYSFNTSGAVSNGSVVSILHAASKIGTRYCEVTVNSTGRRGKMTASGSRSVSANDMVLQAWDLPTNSFGIFLYSADAGFVANPGTSVGNLCLGGSIGRAVGGAVQNSGSSGAVDTLANLGMLPTPTGPIAGLPGDVLHLQYWHRDSVGGAATSNLTNPIQIQLAP